MNLFNDLAGGSVFDLTVLNLLIRITVILAIAWLTAGLFQKWAAIRHAILLSGIVCVFALPVAMLAASALSLPRWKIEVATDITPASTTATESVCLITTKSQENYVVRTAGGETPGASVTTVSPCDAPAAGSTATPSPAALPGPTATTPSWNIFPIAAAIWAIFALVRLGGLGRSLVQLRTIVRRAHTVEPQPALSLFNRIQRRVDLPQPPELRESTEVATPFAAGIVGNYILVPAGWTRRLSHTELYSVLCHETAHLARRDHRVVILQEILVSLLWFHPLVHVVNRALARSREEICDNFAIRSVDRPAYCAALFRLAGDGQVSSLSAATSLSSRHWSLEERIRGILDEHRPTVTGISRKMHVAIAAIAVSLCGLTTLPAITAAEPEQDTPQQDAPAEPIVKSDNVEVRHVRGVQAIDDGVQSIRITNQAGNLTIDESGDDQLHIDAAIPVDAKQVDPSTVSEKLEDHLSITAENGALAIAPRGNDGNKPGMAQVDLTISVPSGLAIEAQSADGDIAVSQIEANLVLTVHDGSIAVKSSVTSDLTATTHDGNIAIDTQAATGKIALSAHSGAVTISADRIRGDLNAQSFDGDVTIKASRVDGPLSAVSNQGDVTVALTDSTAGNGEIALTTRAGDIVLAAAAARKVAANAAEGDIVLQLSGSGIQEGLAAATSEGDVVIAIAPETNADLALVTRGGEITIEGQPASGNIINTRLGSGGPRYAVVTNNGSIVIKTADDNVADEKSKDKKDAKSK
jgi:beta-lactamase regulating signal transducer with metallopeptidase domain